MNIVLQSMCSYYTFFVVFLVNYTGKDSSGTIYASFRDLGQILKIRDCPGDFGTVGAYEAGPYNPYQLATFNK